MVATIRALDELTKEFDMSTVQERLEAAVTITPNGCWEWQRRMDRHGYGVIKLGGRSGRLCLAHRVAFETYRGPIPDGLQIDHLCRNRSCINPSHLEAVTSRVNTHRSPIAPAAVNARRAECKHGHPLMGDNLYTYVTKTGYVYRQCKTCNRATSQRHRGKSKATR